MVTPNTGTGYEDYSSEFEPGFGTAVQPQNALEPPVPDAAWRIWPTLITTRPGLVHVKASTS